MKLQACGSGWWLERAMICVLALTAVGWVGYGCGDSDSTGLSPTGPAGELSRVVGCDEKLAARPAGTPSDFDCIEYTYGRRVLHLKHVNTAFNCCPEIEATVAVRADTIFIREHEPQGGCHCLCLYDLEYTVRGLKAGIYRVVVTQEYLNEADQLHDFSLDLREPSSGQFCVKRAHYPWVE